LLGRKKYELEGPGGKKRGKIDATKISVGRCEVVKESMGGGQPPLGKEGLRFRLGPFEAKKRLKRRICTTRMTKKRKDASQNFLASNLVKKTERSWKGGDLRPFGASEMAEKEVEWAEDERSIVPGERSCRRRTGEGVTDQPSHRSGITAPHNKGKRKKAGAWPEDISQKKEGGNVQLKKDEMASVSHF